MRALLPKFVLTSVLIHGIALLAIAASLPRAPTHPPGGEQPLNVTLDRATVPSQSAFPRAARKIARVSPAPPVPALPVPVGDMPIANDTGQSESGVASSPQPVPAAAASNMPANPEPQLGAHQKIQDHLAMQLARYFHYPWFARLRGFEGDVRLSFRVTPDGELENVRVQRGSGFSILDRSALDSLARAAAASGLSQWLNGEPLDMQLAVVYRLTDR